MEREWREWIFTFGFAHTHPKTGEPLRGRFVRITGTFESARVEMIRRFGQAWAFQYASEAEAGVAQYHLIVLSEEETR